MTAYKTYLMGFCPFEGKGITRRLLNASVSMDFKHRLGAPESQPVKSLLTPESTQIESATDADTFCMVFQISHRNREMTNLLQFRRRLQMRVSEEAYTSMPNDIIRHELTSQFLHTINQQKLTLLHNAIQIFPNFSSIFCRGKRIPIRDCANVKVITRWNMIKISKVK